MNFLFWIPHPARFLYLRETIKRLKSEGHTCEILIISKDILEDLLIDEGLEYENLFPRGRKIRWLPILVSSIIYFILTIFRLLNHVKNKKYDVMIGDDIAFVGKFTNVPTIFFTDDDYNTAPQIGPYLNAVDYIVAPKTCNLDMHSDKLINYNSYKALAHLSPKYFSLNKKLIDNEYRNSKLFVIRLCLFKSIHDKDGKKGINNVVLRKLIKILQPHGKIIISSERPIPKEFKNYLYKGSKSEFIHYVSFSELFIGDSCTMAVEAAIVGTPSIEFDDWWPESEQQIELIEKYGIIQGFQTKEYMELFSAILIHFQEDSPKKSQRNKVNKLVNQKMDITSLNHWILSNFPSSMKLVKNNFPLEKNSDIGFNN